MKKPFFYKLMPTMMLILLAGCLPIQLLAGPALTALQHAAALSVKSGQSGDEETLVPVTGQAENVGCPGFSQAEYDKMLEMGAYFYDFYCAGCHGRQGQGFPTTSFFPRLDTSRLAVSEEIDSSLLRMMNTDIHPHASLLFEKDALSVINYIRLTFADNPSLICPGDVLIQINP